MFQPKKVMLFEDAKQRAWQWKKAIEGLQKKPVSDWQNYTFVADEHGILKQVTTSRIIY